MILPLLDLQIACIYNVYMATKLKMWGNSLGVHIPKHVSDELGLREGSDVQVFLEGRTIAIKSVRRAKKVSLKQLVSTITRNNRHGEAWEGMRGPAGHEVW